jgi:phage regulator Rha-like protein
MNQLSITNDCITSLELAQFSNKEHKHLLEAIRNMEPLTLINLTEKA